MKLTIRRNQGDTRDVELIRKAVPFMLKRLLKPEQLETLSVHVVLTKLQDDLGNVDIEEAPKFRLRLHHEMDTLLMIVTLAHELVHLSQVMHGRLQLREINDLTVWYWDRKPYGSEPYADPDRTLPWESDANRMEGELACRFFTHYVKNLNAS